MKAVVQRVRSASVEVGGARVGAIEHGLLVYLGVGRDDDDGDVLWLCKKLLALRIFPDEAEKMNRSVVDVGGALLVVSQFTLFADLQKGNRPSFAAAAPPERAEALYERFVATARESVPVQTGRFRADMTVASVGYGPITLTVSTPPKPS